MIPFYVILGILIACSFFDIIKIPPNFHLWLIVVLTSLLIGFAGFRYDNPDWQNYWGMYKESFGGEFAVSPDLGFNILIFLVSSVGYFPILMFFTVAVISVSLNVYVFQKYTSFVFSCLLLYFVHNYVLKDMIQIRAGLACAVCLYSLYFLRTDREKQFFIVWLLAVTIHFSTVVFGLVYIVYKIKPSSKFLFYSVLICIVIGTVYPFGQIVKSTVGLSSFDDRIEDYVAYGDVGFAQALGIWTNPNTVKCLIIFLLCFFFYEKLDANYQYFRPLFYSYSAGLCWLLCFNDFSIIAARISNIFLCGEPILLTYPFCLFSKKSRVFYLIGIIIISSIIFYMNISPDKIVPYKFYFSESI